MQDGIPALGEALKDYHRGVTGLRRFVPGGLPLAEDRRGILKRVIREHGIVDDAMRIAARRHDALFGLPPRSSRISPASASVLSLAAGDCSPVCGTISFANTLGEDILQWSSLIYTAVLWIDGVASTVSISIAPAAGSDLLSASISGLSGIVSFPLEILVAEGSTGGISLLDSNHLTEVPIPATGALLLCAVFGAFIWRRMSLSLPFS